MCEHQKGVNEVLLSYILQAQLYVRLLSLREALSYAKSNHIAYWRLKYFQKQWKYWNTHGNNFKAGYWVLVVGITIPLVCTTYVAILSLSCPNQWSWILSTPRLQGLYQPHAFPQRFCKKKHHHCSLLYPLFLVCFNMFLVPVQLTVQ